jgi:serine protease Do
MMIREKVFNAVIMCIVVSLLSFAFMGFSNRKIDLYENMVNASVVIYPNGGGGGSGVFIYDNVVLTAAHVLDQSNAFNIELANGTVLESDDFYIDTEEDVGFVFVDANELYISKISMLPKNLGDTVYLVGAPFHKFYKFTMTKGIISHLDRDEPIWNWKDLLQVDANGGPGSSGGPLYNIKGDIIGIYVGHPYNGGVGIGLCESAESILEAYKRCMESRNAAN